jgi:hypothetical protein
MNISPPVVSKHRIQKNGAVDIKADRTCLAANDKQFVHHPPEKNKSTRPVILDERVRTCFVRALCVIGMSLED